MSDYKLIIFDMDGTILDTLDDLMISINTALAAHNLPQRSRQEVRAMIGNGIRRLVEQAVPADTPLALVDSVYDMMMPHYQAHCKDHTQPYSGVIDLMTTLKERGYLLSVVSNKADPAVQVLSDDYFPGLFDMSVGAMEGVRPKPAPDTINQVLKRLAVERDQTLYIGDSEVDIATSHNVPVDLLLVDWGFRDRADLMAQGAQNIVSNCDEILMFLNR